MKYRVLVEIEYFIALTEIPLPQLTAFDQGLITDLRDLYLNFTSSHASEIKEIEKTTNHDVKAVEYFLKNRFDEFGIGEFKEFIHFGLTSQDINNTAVPLSLKEGILHCWVDELRSVKRLIQQMADDYRDQPMLARTHGQPASPTRMGKEMEVFNERIQQQLDLLDTIPFAGKFGGATGNFNAHKVAYPNIDWLAFGDNFLEDYLGLHRSHPTTQIEHYDHLAALFDNIARINTILVDFSRDMWQYISMNYFTQKVVKGEIGSSAMPHKVNPIDFENAEGNLGIANAIFHHLSAKLPISRLQRDLTDSTVLRNVGVPFAHSVIGLKSLAKGINKIQINADALQKELEENWAVVAEAIQSILRRENYPNPYETLLQLTRTGKAIKKDTIAEFIESLEVSEEVKEELRAISPQNYTGL